MFLAIVMPMALEVPIFIRVATWAMVHLIAALPAVDGWLPIACMRLAAGDCFDLARGRVCLAISLRREFTIPYVLWF